MDMGCGHIKSTREGDRAYRPYVLFGAADF
jgi:hypothetical protein